MIQSNLIFIAIAELLIYNGGLLIKYPVSAKIDFFTPLVGEKYGVYYNAFLDDHPAFTGIDLYVADLSRIPESTE